MSSFAGLVGPRGSTVDPALVQRLASAIDFCGPDRRGSWQQGETALLHALLRTTFEDEGDRQPVSLDGDVQLVSDARIDGRDELLRALRAAGQCAAEDAPDSELILHAYHAWAEGCVERLIGDYAFAIWNNRTRRLFCARDRFGIVPFYYAVIGGALVFADTVQALLAHPRLDRTLNRATIGDYLLFGHAADPAAGFFQHVHRLPPAHWLIYQDGACRTQRFWTPPEPQPRYRKARDMVESFAHVMGLAVKDRLRTPKVAISLSGGMDSTLVAAIALRHAPAGVQIQAYSSGCDWLVADNELPWARRCAAHLGLPFQAVGLEDDLLHPPRDTYWRDAPEPRFWMRRLTNQPLLDRVVASGARVMLMGHGGDALAGGGRTRWAELAARHQYLPLLWEAGKYARHFGRRPPLAGIFRPQRAITPHGVPLDADFAAEQKLEERWRAARASAVVEDPRRNMAQDPFWAELCCGHDPESLHLPLKVRQPFFDVRLLTEALSLPSTPWLFDKLILRQVGEGLLPRAILTRPKTAYVTNLYWEVARRGHEGWLAELGGATELDGIVDRAQLAENARNVSTLGPGRYLRGLLYPASLAVWLRRQHVHNVSHS
jgi:asparagine synthase (glutamine-hydrolysing)